MHDGVGPTNIALVGLVHWFTITLFATSIPVLVTDHATRLLEADSSSGSAGISPDYEVISPHRVPTLS